MMNFSKILLILLIGLLLIIKPFFSFGLHTIHSEKTPDQFLAMESSELDLVSFAKKYKSKSMNPSTVVPLEFFKDSIPFFLPMSILVFIRSFISLIKRKERLLPVQFQSTFFLLN